ncbi:glycoside hydrolase [Mycena floridula]|nr:glycoside hydrolase [Mycena floridula]
MLVTAYYPDWVSDSFPPEKIAFSKFDIIYFAFAIPTAECELTWDSPGSSALLQKLRQLAEPTSTKITLSIGGWTDSQHFSNCVATQASRQTFVSNILATYENYRLGGIDIDWEFPGQEGNPGNVYKPCDTSNFLFFLQLLRQTLPGDALITAAVQTTPFVGPDQQPLKDVSSFALVLNWIFIMNYDTWGASSEPGPNAPLYDGSGHSSQREASAAAAFDAWTKANFPAEQLILGLPCYGYVSKSDAQKLRTRMDSRLFKATSRDTLTNSGAIQADDGSMQGEVAYNTLMKQDLSRCKKHWDYNSATPYLVCPGQVVSYDDEQSIGMKSQFAKKSGMGGVGFWVVSGDTDQWDLTNAAWNALTSTN